MKTFKVDFSHGLNLVTDKRMLPEGYIVLADNIDLRSGAIRPFKMPEPYIGISGNIPAGTTCIWEFKNSWFFSSYYRQYVGEYTSTQTRVYFCETGIGAAYGAAHLIPQKVVNGTQAQLGTVVPTLSPQVTPTLADAPSSFLAAVSNTGGYLPTGQYSYRIAAIIDNNVLPPTQAILANVPQVAGVDITTGKITLSWKSVPNASGYIIFGRALGQEQTLFTLGSGASSVIDLGNLGPSGAYAINYQPLNPLTYVYTYVRNVGTMQDESGPSPVSNTVNSSYTRIVTRYPNTDGFYNDASAYSANTTASTNMHVLNIVGASYTAGKLLLLVQDPLEPYNLIGYDTPWWVNGMKLVFGIDSTQTAYSFSLPAPLSPPSNVTLTAVAGGAIGAGAYDYFVCATRGPINQIYNYPTNLPAMTNGATNSITLGSTSSVKVVWEGISGASGYAIWRTVHNSYVYDLAAVVPPTQKFFTDTGATITSVVVAPTLNNTGVTYNSIDLSIPAGWFNPSATIPGNIIVLDSEGIPGSVLTSYADAGFTSTTQLAASYITTFSPAFVGADQDALNITSATYSGMLGISTYYQDSRVVNTLSPFINAFTPTSETINTLYDVPNNGYIKYWNIYRAGDTGTAFSFVSQQPIGVTTYTDIVGTTNLGEALPTQYADELHGGVSHLPASPGGFDLSPII